MIHVEREVAMTDMTAPDHNKKITQMLKDEWLNERKPLHAFYWLGHPRTFRKLILPIKRKH